MTVKESLLWAMFVFFPLLCYPHQGIFGVLEAKFIGLLVFSFLGLVVLVGERKKIEKQEWVLFSFLLLALISSLFAKDKGLALLGSSYRYDGFLTLLCYGLVYLYFSHYGKLTDSLLFAMLISGALISLLGFAQYFNLGEVYLTSFSDRAYGLMGNPNFYGSYLSLLLPLSLYVYFEKKSWLGLVFFLLFLLALGTSMTRSAWLGSAVALVFFLLVYGYGRREKLKKLAVLGLCILVILGAFLSQETMRGRLVSIFTDGKALLEEAPSKSLGTGRLAIWKKSIELIKEHPLLGLGPDNMLLPSQGEEIGIDKAHNEYLDRAVSTGIPSLLLYLLFLAMIVAKAWKKRGDPLVLALLASLLAYLLQAFFNIAILMVYPLFMALLGALNYRVREETSSCEKSFIGYSHVEYDKLETDGE